MSTSRRLHEAVEASRLGGRFAVSEDPGRVILSSEMSEPALQAWSAVVDACPDWLRLSFQDEIRDRVQPAQTEPGAFLRVTVTFDCPAGTLHLLTPEGWRSALTSDARMSSVRDVFLAFAEAGFDTLGFRLRPWLDDPAEPEARATVALTNGPRRFVRSGSAGSMPPTRIEPWILTDGTPSGAAGAGWAMQACRMIARSLPNEIYEDQSAVKVRLVGQPPRDLPVGEVADPVGSYDRFRQAAEWVYVDASDVEIRHTFLSSELARAWSDGAPFADRLPERLGSALDSAKLLYRAHLRSGSKDTLKALADLRKSLSDEIQKLVQQARDLSASVWRDVAVAIAAVGLKAVTDGTKGSSSWGFGAIYLSIAVYVVLSFAMSISTHRSYLSIVTASLGTWRTKLYGFLNDEDWVTLASKPVRDARRMYVRTEACSALVVTFVVLGLTALAIYEFQNAAPKPFPPDQLLATVVSWLRRLWHLFSMT